MNVSVQEPKRNNPCWDSYSFCIMPAYLLFLLRKVRDMIFRSGETTRTSLCNETLAVALQVAVA